MNILLVEPEFPIPSKSKNHKNFLPIGLLKLYDYFRSIGYNTKLARGNKDRRSLGTRYRADQVMITSLFTYWSQQVKKSVEHYKAMFPGAKVIVGGIYASLLPQHCKDYTGCDEVFVGIHKGAEEYASKHRLSYDMLENPHPLDYQIIHTSRGCFRKCRFCGTWRLEPVVNNKKSIKTEVCGKRLVFYDNNLLANPFIENILDEIIQQRGNKNYPTCESQSGFDGRILLERPYLAALLKQAGFSNPRIAWDDTYESWQSIKRQLDVLVKGGFRSKQIFVFMLYNYKIDFQEMEKKRLKCWEWKVQIADCRYRPLNQTFDNYLSYMKEQSGKDYFIDPKWTDAQIRQFRRNVRRQNICVRQSLNYYSSTLSRKRVDQELSYDLRHIPFQKVKKILPDAWSPVALEPEKSSVFVMKRELLI